MSISSSDRVRRRIGDAYRNVTNTTCSRFCAEDTSGKKSPRQPFGDVTFECDTCTKTDFRSKVTQIRKILALNKKKKDEKV